MPHDSSKKEKFRLGKYRARILTMHLCFFILRYICVVIVLGLSVSLGTSSTLVITKRYDSNFINLFNLFALYMIFGSRITENIFKCYISIMIMVYNAVLVMFAISTSEFGFPGEYWIVVSILAGSYVVEAAITTYILYCEHHSNNMMIFRKIGAEPKINRAFATRRCLEAFGEINMFFGFITSLQIINFPFVSSEILLAFGIALAFMTFIEQLFISCFFHDEFVMQRKIAILLTIIKIPIPILMIVYRPKVFIAGTDYSISSFFTFRFGAVLAVSFCMVIVLFLDYIQFGSGLKSYFKVKTTSVTLSTREHS